VDWLLGKIEAWKPRLLVIGPHYQMCGGDPNAEEPARAAARVLNKARDIAKMAMVIEAHQPHGNAEYGPPERPYGASLWTRWPEYGLCLKEVPGGTGLFNLKQWRGARGDGTWPERLLSSV
jgi:replicative DNA helicase